MVFWKLCMFVCFLGFMGNIGLFKVVSKGWSENVGIFMKFFGVFVCVLEMICFCIGVVWI